MGTRHLDPPVRAGWIRRLPPHKATTALLRQYLESRVGCADPRESVACKSFLKSVNAAIASGKYGDIDLSVVQGVERDTVSIFVYIRGVGPLLVLPTLQTQCNDRLKQIMREASPMRLHLAAPDRELPEFDPFADDEPKRMIPHKAAARLIPGKRPT